MTTKANCVCGHARERHGGPENSGVCWVQGVDGVQCIGAQCMCGKYRPDDAHVRDQDARAQLDTYAYRAMCAALDTCDLHAAIVTRRRDALAVSLADYETATNEYHRTLRLWMREAKPTEAKPTNEEPERA